MSWPAHPATAARPPPGCALQAGLLYHSQSARENDPYLVQVRLALEGRADPIRMQRALDARVIEIAPLAYMRGRTLADAFIILDEAQNATGAQMKMLPTRLGVNSKVGGMLNMSRAGL